MDEEIIKNYIKNKSLYEDFKVKIESLIKELLTNNSINYHKLEARVKGEESLQEKIKKKHNNGNFLKIDDITDLVGIRIITYFEDEIDKVAEVIEKEFTVDQLNSTDKRIKDGDRFGYQSLHFVVTIKENRHPLTEYKRYIGHKFEIQIRSILQHAWAEIEHDIGYKGEITIPSHLKRDFSRISALLEIADKEFIKVRESSTKYRENVLKNTNSELGDNDINMDSLTEFINRSELVNTLDKKISEIGKSTLINAYSMSEGILQRAKFIGLEKISELSLGLEENKSLIEPFAREVLTRFGDGKGGTFHIGISIFYLLYIMAFNRGYIEFLVDKFAGNDGNPEFKDSCIKILTELTKSS